MTIERVDGGFSVCKVADWSQVSLEREFCFTGRTDGERSLVCRTCDVPSNTTERDDGWRVFRVRGTMDFSLIGVMARISTVLAEGGVSIFALSTYDTDYILTKAGDFERALKLLAADGYDIA